MPYIDGVDARQIVMEGSVTHQHNRPSFARVRMPSDVAFGSETSRLKVVTNGTLDFHGACVHIEDDGDEDEIYTTMTFADPTLLFEMRPVRDGVGSGDVGDFSKPSVIGRRKYGPQILEEVLTQSLDDSDPADGEGPMGIALGTFATGGADLSGAPADWPMTIAELVALLADTGELDVVNTPVDGGATMGVVSAYNGDWGSDLTGSVQFRYATGSTSNVRRCRRTIDLADMCNKLWLYLGPRVGTKADPPGDQHWDANVTGTDPLLPDPPQSTILSAVAASRSSFFTRMQIRIFDGDGVADMLPLYRRWWQMETWMRCRPKTMVHVTPDRGIAPAFRTGDLISVQAGSRFRGGFSGAQRVMEYTYRWDNDGVLELGEPIGVPNAPAVVASYQADGLS